MRYDPDCRRCPRLVEHLEGIRARFPGYHARPVAPFGDEGARLLIVGLAPGLHGANRTGRPFCGDHAGVILYRTLHDFGFASAPVSSTADDGLLLIDCRISNAVKCLPPGNKPTTHEISNCNSYLSMELNALPELRAILALGRVAHAAVLRALRLRAGDFAFRHGAEHRLSSGLRLADCYHCSRYNTQTGRLTETMFRAVFARLRAYLDRDVRT